jgi:hypothetical protein
MYAVYNSPNLYPGHYVAKQWVCDLSPVPKASGIVFLGKSLEQVRQQLPAGMNRITLNPDNDPCFVEMWI